MIIKRIFCILISLLDMFVFYHGGEARFMDKADVNISINKYSQQQTFNGFGASACWWAQDAGNSEYCSDIAKALYSKDGLGLNIYRYNIGGGEKDNPNSRIRGNRATESFYYYNEETKQYEYDFTRDAGARKMLDEALSYGCIDTVVLFANSPHYSMTVSGQATGGTESFQSNLPPENYQAYADYFLTITQHFLDEGIPVKYISPINEPQWSWGGEWVGQEGCHYEKDEVVALLKVFAKEITARGMDVKLMGPESGEVGAITEEYFAGVTADEDISKVLGSLAYHSYWSDVNTQGKINFGEKTAELYPNINVDMTEWCELPCSHDIEDFASAVLMARVISQDISLTKANSWSSWVGVNNYAVKEDGKKFSDGLLVMDENCTELYTAQRYYAMAHFSKFIPAGSVGLAVNTDVKDLFYDQNTLTSVKSLNISAFKTPEGKIVCVLVNEGETRNTILNIVTGKMSVWQSTKEAQMKNIYNGWAKGIVKLPANSITTIVYG